MSEENENLATAYSLIRIAFNEGRPREAAEQCLGPYYRQHNPLVADGVEAFVKFATQLTQEFPDLHIEPRRNACEGDLVMVHSEMTGASMSPEHHADGITSYAVFDTYRFEDGRIVEHWDMTQPIPAASANDNGMV